ncbi:hypothetical protein [Bacillus solitudinis]|uniref:hypothetical protein n=1 Tax=Bacillus solitudinis TaxID=2014074 RepID=UPI0012FE32F6|nr:hypothetical protein [Bacillus solitudinis]
MQEVILSQEELEERLAYWQEKLRLRDWIITIRIVREKEMDPNRAAEISWTLSKKMASVRILDPIDYPDGLMAMQDMENSLVHELLHLHFAPIHEDAHDREHYEVFEEQAIESITHGLIAVARK